MMDKIDEVRSLLTEPEVFNRLAARYEADPTEENLRAVIDQMTIELAAGRIKQTDSNPEEYSEPKDKPSSASPVCFVNSDEIRNEYKDEDNEIED